MDRRYYHLSQKKMVFKFEKTCFLRPKIFFLDSFRIRAVYLRRGNGVPPGRFHQIQPQLLAHIFQTFFIPQER